MKTITVALSFFCAVACAIYLPLDDKETQPIDTGFVDETFFEKSYVNAFKAPKKLAYEDAHKSWDLLLDYDKLVWPKTNLAPNSSVLDSRYMYSAYKSLKVIVDNNHQGRINWCAFYNKDRYYKIYRTVMQKIASYVPYSSRMDEQNCFIKIMSESDSSEFYGLDAMGEKQALVVFHASRDPFMVQKELYHFILRAMGLVAFEREGPVTSIMNVLGLEDATQLLYDEDVIRLQHIWGRPQ